MYHMQHTVFTAILKSICLGWVNKAQPHRKNILNDLLGITPTKTDRYSANIESRESVDEAHTLLHEM